MLGTCPLSQLSWVPQPKDVFWVCTLNIAAQQGLSSCKEPWAGCHIHPAPPNCQGFQVRAAGASWEHSPHWRSHPDGLKVLGGCPAPGTVPAPSILLGKAAPGGVDVPEKAREPAAGKGESREWHAGRCQFLVTRGRRRRLLRHCLGPRVNK